MVSLRGQKKLEPRPDPSPLGVQFKISDERPHPFHMWSPLPPPSPRGVLILNQLRHFSIPILVSVTRKELKKASLKWRPSDFSEQTLPK